MAVRKEDIEKIRAQGLTHFATLLESHSQSSIDESDAGVAAGDKNTDGASDGISALFEGQDEATIAKAKELFEAAVEKKSADRMTLLEAQVSGMMEAYAKKQDKTVNEYLDTVVTEWIKENEIKIYDASIVEQAKTMMTQVKAMFEGMGIDFDDQVLAKKLAESEVAIAESNAIIEAQEAELVRHEITAVISEAKVGLTDEQATAFDVIVGECEFEGIEKLKELVPTMLEAAKKSDDEQSEPKGDDEAAEKKVADELAAKKVAESEAAALAEAEAKKVADELAAKAASKNPLIEATLAQLRRGSKPKK